MYIIDLATWYEEPTHWKRPWCWERLKVGGEGNNRRWDGWTASPTQWTWVWVSSRSWWRTGKPGVLQSMGSQRVGHDWVTELNWYSVNNMFCWIKEQNIIDDPKAQTLQTERHRHVPGWFRRVRSSSLATTILNLSLLSMTKIMACPSLCNTKNEKN